MYKSKSFSIRKMATTTATAGDGKIYDICMSTFMSLEIRSLVSLRDFFFFFCSAGHTPMTARRDLKMTAFLTAIWHEKHYVRLIGQYCLFPSLLADAFYSLCSFPDNNSFDIRVFLCILMKKKRFCFFRITYAYVIYIYIDLFQSQTLVICDGKPLVDLGFTSRHAANWTYSSDFLSSAMSARIKNTHWYAKIAKKQNIWVDDILWWRLCFIFWIYFFILLLIFKHLGRGCDLNSFFFFTSLILCI